MRQNREESGDGFTACGWDAFLRRAPLFGLLFLLGCTNSYYIGSGLVTGSGPPTSNWSLAGDRSQNAYPVLSLALFADSQQVQFFGYLEVKCQGGFVSEEDESLAGTVPLQPDGSFHFVSTNLDIGITLDGTVPAAGQTAWRGSYSLTSSAGCVTSQHASFDASVLQEFNGSYAGTLRSTGTYTQPTSVGIRTSFSQGTAVSGVLNGATASYLPFDAKVSLSGPACFSQGTSLSGTQSSIGGLLFQTVDKMEDGSLLIVAG